MGKRKPMSREKAIEIIEYVAEHGFRKTWIDYGIKSNSLRRRLREIKAAYNFLVEDINIDPQRVTSDDRNGNRILVIGDLHEPFCRDGYLEFCKDP